MTIEFNEIGKKRVPGHRVELDNSMAAPTGAGLPYKALLIGPATDAGTETDTKTLIDVYTADEVGAKYGFGSFLHLMAKAYFSASRGVPCAIIASAREALASATSKAGGSISISVTTATAGTLYIYIAGQRITVPVTAGQAANSIASAIKEAITPASGTSEYPHLPVVAAINGVNDYQVDLTAKNIGAIGDDLDVRMNYYAGESTPSGVTVTISAMSGGSSDPDLGSGSPSLIDNLADNWYQIWASAYTDTANITNVHDELVRRMDGNVAIDGICFMGDHDTVSNLVTKWDAIDGSGKNSEHLCVPDAGNYLSPPFEVAAAAAGAAIRHLRRGPGNESKPFATLPLYGIVGPAASSRRLESEQETLLNSGVSTLRVDASGTVRVQRLITNYMQNAQGAPDESWLGVNTRFTAMFLRWDWDTYLTSKYPQAKLTGDDTQIGPGQSVMTPKIGKSEALARYRYWMTLGLVEDFDGFKETLLSERSGIDVNTMDWMMEPNFVNQFYASRTRMRFRL